MSAGEPVDRWQAYWPRDVARLVSVTRASVALQVAVVVAYVLVDPPQVGRSAVWAVLVVGGVGLGLLLQPWRPASQVRLPLVAVYLWFLGSFLALLVWVGGAAPGPPLLWLLLWGLVAVNVGFTIPPRGQAVLCPVALAALVGGLLFRGVPGPDVVFAASSYVGLALLVSWQGAAERSAAAAAHSARVDAEVRARLLAGLARVNQLDVVSASDAAVATMLDLGFEMAIVGRVDEDAGTMQALSAVGFEDIAFLGEVLDIGDGLAGEAITSHSLVQVPDYAVYEHRLPGPGRDELGATVAVPVVVEGRVVACVHGSRRETGAVPRAQVEVIEVLAAQLGRVFEMADRYDRERAVAAELAELDRMKRQFITSVSHELRTPMTMLQGFGETLRRHLGSLDADERVLLLERLMVNAARLDRLITSLLDLSRVEGANLQVRPEEVMLEEVVLDVVRDLDPLADGHRVLLDLQAPVVTADRAMLAHVLRHLLSNALLHTPPGTTVTVGSTPAGAGARVRVVDDGPGIPADRIARVAERFYRATPVADGRGGLGIGLSLVRAMLEAHGSRLELSSETSGHGLEGAAGGPGLAAEFTLLPSVGPAREASPGEATDVRSPR